MQKSLFLILAFLLLKVTCAQQIEPEVIPFLSSENEFEYKLLEFTESMSTRQALKLMSRLNLRPATADELHRYYKDNSDENFIFVSPRAYYIKAYWIGTIKMVPIIYKNKYYFDYFRGSKWPAGTKFLGIKN